MTSTSGIDVDSGEELPPTYTCQTAPQENHAQRETNGISVLLVDDEAALLDIGKIYLERTSEVSVTCAESAKDALALLTKQPFDAIVSDYQMPDMDGISFLKALRQKNRTIPFIIFTGKGREEIVIEALNSGADGYLQKGGEVKAQYIELAHTILRAVRQRRAEIALLRKHEILGAILAASPHGIAFVRNRTLQWTNDTLAAMLGYKPAELKGMHIRNLYEDHDTYEKIGEQIQSDLNSSGRSKIITRYRHKSGSSIEYEIHIAPLDKGNLHFGHMIMMTDISDKLALAGHLLCPTCSRTLNSPLP